MGSRGGRRWVSVAALRLDASLGTEAQPTHLILVHFPTIRSQLEHRSSRLSEAKLRDLEVYFHS